MKKGKTRVTFDGVALLNDVLDKAGYGEQLAEVYDEFEIDSLDGLAPSRYRAFADALTKMAVGEPAREERADDGDPFAFVPKEARGCMTDKELDNALRDMCLSPAMENAVREVCRKGFVYAPGLKTKETVSQAQEEEAKDEHELEVDKRLADGDYHGVAFNAFLDILHAAQLLNSAIYQAHRVEHLTSIKCPDIVTTKQVEIARAKIEAAQNMLDTAERDLRKLQLKTDHRTDEQRLLDAVFGGKKREGGKRHEQ